MIVSLSQFRELARDANGSILPMPKGRNGATEVRTSAGDFTALATTTKFVRVATDTAVYIDIEGGAVTSADELLPANSVEYFAVDGGEVLKIAATA